jgi:hypothetical protein
MQHPDPDHEPRSTQPLWVRVVAVIAIVALLAFVVAQIL